MELFAANGFDATTVGAIEKAAGLAPRSGALYKYFSGKEHLLAAAIERKVRSLDELGGALEMLPLGDLRAELTLLARWNLRSLRERDGLTRFVLRDAEHLPAALREVLYERLVERPYAQVAAWVSSRIGGPVPGATTDVYAVSLILVESMAAYNTLRAAFGQVPDGVDDERFVDAWVQLASDAIERSSAPAEQTPSAP
jgi:AcrR family transcriptional regulator